MPPDALLLLVAIDSDGVEEVLSEEVDGGEAA